MHFVGPLFAASDGAVSNCGGFCQLALLGLCFAVWARVWGKGRVEAQARRIRAMQMALLSDPHEYGPVRVSDFYWLDSRYYSEMERRLDAKGFRNLGDVENLTRSAAFPWMRTAARELVGEDGVLTAAIWQIKIRGWRRVLSLVGMGKGDEQGVDVWTEFSDGTFLATANNRGLDFSSDVPGIERIGFSDGIAIEEMLEVHRQRFAEYLAMHPGTQPVRIRTTRELRQSVTRAHEFQCAAMARNRFIDLPQFAGLVLDCRLRELDPPLRKAAHELARLEQRVNRTSPQLP